MPKGNGKSTAGTDKKKKGKEKEYSEVSWLAEPARIIGLLPSLLRCPSTDPPRYRALSLCPHRRTSPSRRSSRKTKRRSRPPRPVSLLASLSS
jgi:hypothetical protein